MVDKEQDILRAFGPGDIADRAIAETRAKHADADTLRARLVGVTTGWSRTSARLRDQIIPAATMRAMLTAAGAPASAAAIGVSAAHLRRTVMNARFLRDRYTLLDLLDETRLLAAAVDATIPASPRDAQA